MNTCLYCEREADSLEHVVPAAFGEFENAPNLLNRICKVCNNALGQLDEQLSRCGPEGFLRKKLGIRGRQSHDKVNPFERGSSRGQRLDLTAWDAKLGIRLALECDNGTIRNMREIVAVEESGKTHHLPIPKDATAEQLRCASRQLGIAEPLTSLQYFYLPEEKEWVNRLIKEAWPELVFTEGETASSGWEGAIGKASVTDRYFRAIAKIAFHYFLTQFPEYTGHESMFSDIRKFILTESGIDSANQLMTRYLEHQAPDGWLEHRISAGVVPGGCFAVVKIFISREWPAPEYQVTLAQDLSLVGSRAFAHSYRFYEKDEPKGKYSGTAHPLHRRV